MERSVLQGLAMFRWVAWAWMAVVLGVSRHDLAHPGLAAALVGAALVVTVADTSLWRAAPWRLLGRVPVLAELAAGAALVTLDGLARRGGTVLTVGQSIGSTWPLVGILSAGVAFGPGWGAAAGGAMGGARIVSTVVNDVRNYSSTGVLSLTNTVLFYALAGGVAGYVYQLLVRAREEVAGAQAREEVARTLHDGVLQTLAVVERRAGDPALSRLAREQERDLREFLFGSKPATSDLGAALRAAAARFEDVFGGRVQVLVPDDLEVGRDAVAAMAGAVGEALTNAGKHGGAGRVVVFVDDEDGLFCSVKDDGCGFDPAATPEGVGLSRSIRGRIEDAGGRVEVTGAHGRGSEVRLWLP
ncbi:MAG TPA: ATP-binding protein [Acidimicrobiales bacterium]|nr:ATP-binding protein [Acidimicrobiales bacterium]